MSYRSDVDASSRDVALVNPAWTGGRVRDAGEPAAEVQLEKRSRTAFHRMTHAAARLVRLLTPAPLRPRVRELLFEWLRIDWELATAVRIHLGNFGDWVVYNEIFQSGEYDHAIALAFDRAAASGRVPHVVDLGANSGFFTLRVLHEARLRGTGVSVTAVEAHPATADRFRSRMDAQSIVNEEVVLVHGLAGERAGSGVLFEDLSRGSFSTQIRLRTPADPPGTDVCVDYVDLSDTFKDVPVIDLLKCDIEGCEEPVIENYSDVFSKVNVAVFELHRDMCDVSRCQDMLRGYGFTHATIFRQGLNFTYGVWR